MVAEIERQVWVESRRQLSEEICRQLATDHPFLNRLRFAATFFRKWLSVVRAALAGVISSEPASHCACSSNSESNFSEYMRQASSLAFWPPAAALASRRLTTAPASTLSAAAWIVMFAHSAASSRTTIFTVRTAAAIPGFRHPEPRLFHLTIRHRSSPHLCRDGSYSRSRPRQRGSEAAF